MESGSRVWDLFHSYTNKPLTFLLIQLNKCYNLRYEDKNSTSKVLERPQMRKSTVEGKLMLQELLKMRFEEYA